MNPTVFLLSLGVAIAAPWLLLHSMIPALRRAAAAHPCSASEGLQFWLVTLRWLAMLGTLTLVLAFGEFRAGADLLDVLRRTLGLVAAGLFISLALMARVFWRAIRHGMQEQERRQWLRELRTTLPHANEA